MYAIRSYYDVDSVTIYDSEENIISYSTIPEEVGVITSYSIHYTKLYESFFKNPPDYSAGRLIEEAGLKGFSIGGAKVSETHANFIINTGTASAANIFVITSYSIHYTKLYDMHEV